MSSKERKQETPIPQSTTKSMHTEAFSRELFTLFDDAEWTKATFLKAVDNNLPEVVSVLFNRVNSETLEAGFLSAAKKGLTGIFSVLLSKVNLDARDEIGSTALMHAAENGRLEVVNLLIAANANIDAKNNKPGITPLHYAANEGVVNALLAAKADIHDKDNEYKATPLIWAASNGRTSAVEALLKVNEPGIINNKDCYGATPLLHAANKGHVDTVRLLVRAGADIKIKALKGESLADVATRSAKNLCADYPALLALRFEGLYERILQKNAFAYPNASKEEAKQATQGPMAELNSMLQKDNDNSLAKILSEHLSSSKNVLERCSVLEAFWQTYREEEIYEKIEESVQKALLHLKDTLSATVEDETSLPAELATVHPSKAGQKPQASPASTPSSFFDDPTVVDKSTTTTAKPSQTKIPDDVALLSPADYALPKIPTKVGRGFIQ